MRGNRSGPIAIDRRTPMNGRAHGQLIVAPLSLEAACAGAVVTKRPAVSVTSSEPLRPPDRRVGVVVTLIRCALCPARLQHEVSSKDRRRLILRLIGDRWRTRSTKLTRYWVSPGRRTNAAGSIFQELCFDGASGHRFAFMQPVSMCWAY